MGESIITRIERQAGRERRYHLYIEGLVYPLSIHEEVLIQLGLAKGMRVDPIGIEQIFDLEERTKVKQSALRYLSYRPRTEREVDCYLERAGFAAHHREQVIVELRRFHYLDDQKFAEQWVNERRETKGYGALRLRQELEQKGISAEMIDNALQVVDEEEEIRLALAVAERRYQRLRDLPWKTVERRLGHYLIRRGFHHGLTVSVLNTLRARRDEEKED